jgi:uncharacterized SAM-binding protein YcdF (DUF218 family)
MFLLSKLIGFLLNPLIWVVILLLLGLIVKKRLLLLIRAACLVLVVFTNPLLSNWVMHRLEAKPRTLEASNRYRVGVLLTGMTSGRISKPGVHFESGVDRFTQALLLYRLNIIDRIVISGGSGLLNDQGFSESPLLADLANNLGIPDSALIIESRSRNTYENALLTKPILDSLGVDSCLVITSAFHMTRSLRCFEKMGIKAQGYPADYRAGDLDLSMYSFVPSIGALSTWNTILHEWLGLTYYRSMDYI